MMLRTETRPAELVELSDRDRASLSWIADKIFRQKGTWTQKQQRRFQDTISDVGFRALLDAHFADAAQTAIDCLPARVQRRAIEKLEDPVEGQDRRATLLATIKGFQDKLRADYARAGL